MSYHLIFHSNKNTKDSEIMQSITFVQKIHIFITNYIHSQIVGMRERERERERENKNLGNPSLYYLSKKTPNCSS